MLTKRTKSGTAHVLRWALCLPIALIAAWAVKSLRDFLGVLTYSGEPTKFSMLIGQVESLVGWGLCGFVLVSTLCRMAPSHQRIAGYVALFGMLAIDCGCAALLLEHRPANWLPTSFAGVAQLAGMFAGLGYFLSTEHESSKRAIARLKLSLKSAQNPSKN